MPHFIELDPKEVSIGRGRADSIRVKAFEGAILAGDAGRIEHDGNDGYPAAHMKRLLRQASKNLEIRVRSTWADEDKTVLVWKRTGVR